MDGEPRQLPPGSFWCPEHHVRCDYNPRNGSLFAPCKCTKEQFAEIIERIRNEVSGKQESSEASVAQQRDSALGAQPELPEESVGANGAFAQGASTEPLTGAPQSHAKGSGGRNGAGPKQRPAEPAGTQPRGRPEAKRQRPQTDDVLRRVPPQNLEAEKSVLGAILLDNRATEEAARLVKVTDFYRESNRQVYAAMLGLWQKGSGIDQVTLSQALKAAHHFEGVGGDGYIAELAAFVPTARHTVYYAEIVRDLAIKREIIIRANRVAMLAYDGVSADALVGEAERIVSKELVVSDGLNLPDPTKKPLEPLTWHAMRQRRQTHHREWVVGAKLARGETSGWHGKVEAGKTTITRELVLCVLRGEPFLGCETMKGRVAYIMLDADGEDATFDAFERMGFTDEDGENCLFLFEPMVAQMERGFEQIVRELIDFKPVLVVIDPYPRLRMIQDFHSYSNTYLMAELSHVAKLVDAHLALSGHIPRGRDDDADVATAGLGSVAFGAGVNARFTIADRNDVHTIRSSKGKGNGFEPFAAEYVLLEDQSSHRINLGEPWSWKDKARSYQSRVRDFLEDHSDRPFDVATLAKELRVQRSVVRTTANMLYGAQKIKRGGEGLKADPFIFAALGYVGELTMEAVKNEES